MCDLALLFVPDTDPHFTLTCRPALAGDLPLWRETSHLAGDFELGTLRGGFYCLQLLGMLRARLVSRTVCPSTGICVYLRFFTSRLIFPRCDKASFFPIFAGSDPACRQP